MSLTITVLCRVLSFPDESLTLYVTVYCPSSFTLTPLTTSTLGASSKLSVALTPTSLYSVPASTTTSADPLSVITGATVSLTVTVLCRVLSLPDESLTL